MDRREQVKALGLKKEDFDDINYMLADAWGMYPLRDLRTYGSSARMSRETLSLQLTFQGEHYADFFIPIEWISEKLESQRIIREMSRALGNAYALSRDLAIAEALA